MEQEPKNTAKIHIFSVIIIILCAILVVGAGIYLFQSTRLSTKNVPEDIVISTSDPTPSLSTSATPTTSDTAATACASLTADDKTTITNWLTYQNKDYNYSFKYPKDWQIKSQEKGLLALEGASGEVNLQFRSAEMSSLGFAGLEIESTSDINVACQKATKTVISASADGKAIHVSFTKNNVPHLIIYTFKSQGASYDGDMIELLDIILKTVTFSNS